MQNIAYYILLGLFKAIGALPLRVLYVLSDVLYVLLFCVARYRRKVVDRNLMLVFPDETPAFRRRVRRRFGRYMCDLIVETVKLASASTAYMRRRLSYANTELLEKLFALNKTILVVTSHYGNWEWMATTLYVERFSFTTLYHVLHNPVFERLMSYIRTRFGMRIVSMKQFYRPFIASVRSGRTDLFGFNADQAPKREGDQRTIQFMGRETAVYTGVERLARQYGLPVVYMSIQRPRRGYYHVEARPVAEDGSAVPPGQITATTFAELEKDIRRAPEFWLWSHRRWKRRNDVPAR